MRHFGPGLRRREAHHAGISEQVEKPHFATGLANLVLGKGPVNAVFLEQTQVTERRPACIQSQASPIHRPGL